MSLFLRYEGINLLSRLRGKMRGNIWSVDQRHFPASPSPVIISIYSAKLIIPSPL